MSIRKIENAGDRARRKWWNIGDGNESQYELGPDILSGETTTGINAAGTALVDLLGTDSSDMLRIGGSLFSPVRAPIVLRVQPNASQATAFPFHIKSALVSPTEIDSISCTFDTADGAANTGWITKEGAGVAPGAGVSVQTGTFDLNATANTVQNAAIPVRGTAACSLAPGDQLTFNIATAVTSLKGLVVVVFFKQHGSIPPASVYLNANGAIATKTFYLNVIPGTTIAAVSMRWSTAGTNGSAVTADVTKDTGTSVPGGGTTILAAAQSVKGAANTTVCPALSATASVLQMAAGDRLALKMTGTLTALAGLVVTVSYGPGIWRELVSQDPHLLNQAVDQTMFIADSFYEVLDIWGTWSTVSTSVTNLITKDGGTTAPGAGTGLLTDNTNAGFLTSGTINTPIEGTLVAAKPSLILSPGDRLGSKNGGTAASLAGLVTAVRLRKL